MDPKPESSPLHRNTERDDEGALLIVNRGEPSADEAGRTSVEPAKSHAAEASDEGATMLAQSSGSSVPSPKPNEDDECATLLTHRGEPPGDDEGRTMVPPHGGDLLKTPDPEPPTPAAEAQTLPPGSGPVPAVSAVVPAENYRAGREIARGGMGRILEADDRKLRRAVALKEMLPRSAESESARRRFLREAEVLALLAHPNIVPVHDLVWKDGQPHFYTMKLVHGRTLKEILGGLRKHDPGDLGDFTLDRLLSVFRKVCDAIAFAHNKGILHRDLKPENIMVGQFGEVLVMDWGLARILGEPASATVEAGLTVDFLPAEDETEASVGGLTLEGTVMGTPQFMSPEQASGEVEGLDARSDLYSLGGILYQILTLYPPIEGRTVVEMLEKVRRGSIRAPSDFGSTITAASAAAKGEVLKAAKVTQLPHIPGGRVPAALSAVAMKALRLEKTERYPDVGELSADLEAYQTGFATKAEQAGPARQLLLLMKRHKGIFTTAAAAWLLITALALWFIVNLRAKEQRATAGEARALAGEVSARAAEAVAQKEKEAARQSLAHAAVSLAEAIQQKGDGPAMQAALNEVPEDLRDSTWRYLFEQSDTSIARVRTGTTDLEGVAPNPVQPGVFAVADRNDKVTVLEVRTGRRLLELTPGLPKSGGRLQVAFSADGNRIAVGQAGKSGGIVIHSARDGKKLLQWEAPSSERLEFNRDGGLLLQTTENGTIQVWDTSEGKAAWSYPPVPTGREGGVFTPDGQQVVAMSYQGFQLLNAHDGALVRALPRLSGFSTLAAHSDGTVTALGRGRGRVLRFALGDGKVLADFRAGALASFLALTPDGGRIVTVAPSLDGPQEIRLWDANSGIALQALSGGSGYVRDIAVHPLSGELLVSGANARVWSLAGTPEKWTLGGGMGKGASRSGVPMTWSSRRVPGSQVCCKNCRPDHLPSSGKDRTVTIPSLPSARMAVSRRWARGVAPSCCCKIRARRPSRSRPFSRKAVFWSCCA